MLGSSFSGRPVDEEVDERRLLLDIVLSSSVCAPPADRSFCKDVPYCNVLPEVDGDWVEYSVLIEGFEDVELDGPAEMTRFGGWLF